jgi:Uma2 family endonuclease
MNLAQPRTDRRYSREEFRRWCEAQTKGRYERVDGWIVAMAPERGAHLRVKGAIYKALDRAVTVAGVPCQVLPDGATVETGDSDYEPEALVNCGEPMADDAVAAPNPVIIVEVLSPGTTSTDTGGKLADYFRVPSVAHYRSYIRPAELLPITAGLAMALIHGSSSTDRSRWPPLGSSSPRKKSTALYRPIVLYHWARRWVRWTDEPPHSTHDSGGIGTVPPDQEPGISWLGDLDSNQGCPVQSREFYR